MGRGREEADDEDAELLRCEPLSPLPAPLDFTELTSARVFFLALRFASFAPTAAELLFLLVAGRSGFPSAGTRVCAARGSTFAVGGFAFCCAATALAALKERFVFATGGFNNDWLRECERYDFKSNTWKNLPALLRKRFFHASASFRDEFVYVFCGYAGFGQFLSSIERYTLS